MTRRALSVLLLALLAGCAHPAIVPCPEPCAIEGIRFYRPEVFVVEDGSCNPHTLVLPDHRQQFVLTHEGWLGDVTLQPTLADGWNLTSLSAGTNNDATLAALAGAANSAKTLMGGAFMPRAAAKCPAAGLYHYTEGHLIGPVSP